MKKIIVVICNLLLSTILMAQTPTVTWGEEYKLKRGSTNLEVIGLDNSGIYIKETYSKMALFQMPTEIATLTKLDKDLKEIYTNDFKKELKGKSFKQFFFLNEKMFLLATDFTNKFKTLTLFAAEIDKLTGELISDFSEVANWEKEEKNEGLKVKVTYNYDSTKMVLVSSLEGKEKNNYEIREFDSKLKASAKPITITNEFDPKMFLLHDVEFINNGNIVIVGKEFEYEEGKKKKAKFLDFKNYNIRIYDNTGKQIKQINTTINDKWLVSTKVKQVPDKDIILAAFYSNEKKGKEINGLLVQRINPKNGEIISTNQKDINTSMISTIEDDDNANDEESKKEKKEREKLEKIQNDEDGFSKFMRFRDFIYTADNGIVILAEKFNQYTHTTTSSSPSTGSAPGFATTWRTTITTYLISDCGDIMMCKIDKDGKISWLNILPKQQQEAMLIGSGSGASLGFSFHSYFIPENNWPFYAGFGVLPSTNNINIIFNDSKKNNDVLQLGQKVKSISRFGKSDCFGIILNPLTGKYTRNVLFSNSDVPTAMPRLGKVLGKDLYLIGKDDKIMAKSKIAVARISVK